MEKKRSGSPMPATACTAPPAKSTSARTPAAHRHGVVGVEPHRPFAEPASPPLTHGNRSAPAFGRFAQRPRRQQPAVAVAATPVDHFDLDVAVQAPVLQPVVADHDVATRLDQRARRGDAVAVGAPWRRCGARSAPARRRRARDRCRLRPTTAGLRVRGRNRAWPRRRPALPAQAFDQCDGERGLPLPPAMRFPTTTTGRDTRCARRMPKRSSRSRKASAPPYSADAARRQRRRRIAVPERGWPTPGCAHAAPGSRNCTWCRCRYRPPLAIEPACVPCSTSRPSSSTSTGRRVRWWTGGARSPAWSGPASGGRARPAPGVRIRCRARRWPRRGSAPARP